MFDMSALRANTGTQTVSPCVDSSANNVLLHANPDFNQSLLEFIHILERRLIDPLLLFHVPPELVIDQIEIRAVGGQRSGVKSLGFRTPTVRSFCAPMRWYTLLLKHERITGYVFDSRKYYSK